MIGFTLVVFVLNIDKRKRRAVQVVLLAGRKSVTVGGGSFGRRAFVLGWRWGRLLSDSRDWAERLAPEAARSSWRLRPAA